MNRNLMPTRDREVSVSWIDVPLSPAALQAHFLGREVYRRTTFIVARREDAAAVLRVTKESSDPLFSPVTALELLAGADQCTVVRAPEVDTANPTHMARAARTAAPGARCVVVEGRYGHTSFILDPAPHRISVVDVVPPKPPKLLDQAQRILEVAEHLPPIELLPRLIDLRELTRQHAGGARAYLFPCRGGGVTVEGATVSYLDQRPARADGVLIGCARSRDIYRWFYREEPTYVEMCPRALLESGGGEPAPSGQTLTMPTLTKCCLLEHEIRQEGNLVAVPWGATLDEIREGLDRLVGLESGSRSEAPVWSAG